MTKFNYEISIEAASEQEALTKMAALVTLAAKLKTNELAKLAHIIKTDPVKTALAKKYLGV